MAAACAFAASMAVAQQDSTLSVGTPENSDGIGVPYVAETHGDWQIVCIRAEEGQPEPCQMFQRLFDGEQPAAEVRLFDVPNDETVVAGGEVVTPLNTLLAQPLRLQVDDGPVLRYPFTYCQPDRCVVRIGLTGDDVDSFRRGGEGVVSIVPLEAPDQIVGLTMSLTGFTAAYEDLLARAEAARAAFEAANE